jgi:flagellar basal body-associated protein FliL
VADELLEDQEGAAIEAPAAGGRGLIRLVQAVAFVSVIVVVEIVVASMLAPTAEETRQLAVKLAAASSGKDSHENDAHAADDAHGTDGGHHNVHEVELGMFNITRFNPSTNTTLAIDFELYGTVLAEEVSRFHHEFDHSKARVREQVVMTLHGAESADLTDAGLGLIKRRILEKTNRALGEPLIKEVLFSKFNFVER